MDPENEQAELEVRSFNRSWDNREYLKTFGSLWIRLRFPLRKTFNGLLFGCTLRMYQPS